MKEANDFMRSKLEEWEARPSGVDFEDVFTLIDMTKKMFKTDNIDVHIFEDVESRLMKCCNKKCEVRRTKLFSCSQCRSIFYCSEVCQRSDWKNHKPECNKISGGGFEKSKKIKDSYFNDKKTLFDRNLHVDSVPDKNYNKLNLQIFNFSDNQREFMLH